MSKQKPYSESRERLQSMTSMQRKLEFLTGKNARREINTLKGARAINERLMQPYVEARDDYAQLSAKANASRNPYNTDRVNDEIDFYNRMADSNQAMVSLYSDYRRMYDNDIKKAVRKYETTTLPGMAQKTVRDGLNFIKSLFGN